VVCSFPSIIYHLGHSGIHDVVICLYPFIVYTWAHLMCAPSCCQNHAAPQALLEKSGDAQEAELLTYLCDFASTLQVMTTVKLLSGHADDEHTLNEPNSMITVSGVLR